MGNSVSAQILTLFTAKESRTSAGNELSQATDGPNLHSKEQPQLCKQQVNDPCTTQRKM